MRFSIAAVALFASAVLAQESTVYVTDLITITSCAPTVTNCPARSTVVSTTSYPVISSSSAAPIYPNGTSSAAPTWPTSVAPASLAAGVPTSSPLLSTIAITTCIPTVLYSTITVTPVATPVSAAVSVGTGAPSGAPALPTGPSSPSQFTGAASGLTSSFAVAAVAGAVAVLFA